MSESSFERIRRAQMEGVVERLKEVVRDSQILFEYPLCIRSNFSSGSFGIFCRKPGNLWGLLAEDLLTVREGESTVEIKDERLCFAVKKQGTRLIMPRPYRVSHSESID